MLIYLTEKRDIGWGGYAHKSKKRTQFLEIKYSQYQFDLPPVVIFNVFPIVPELWMILYRNPGAHHLPAVRSCCVVVVYYRKVKATSWRMKEQHQCDNLVVILMAERSWLHNHLHLGCNFAPVDDNSIDKVAGNTFETGIVEVVGKRRDSAVDNGM